MARARFFVFLRFILWGEACQLEKEHFQIKLVIKLKRNWPRPDFSHLGTYPAGLPQKEHLQSKCVIKLKRNWLRPDFSYFGTDPGGEGRPAPKRAYPKQICYKIDEELAQAIFLPFGGFILWGEAGQLEKEHLLIKFVIKLRRD